MKEVEITEALSSAIVGELEQSSLFAGLGEQELVELAKRAAVRQYEPGETVVTQGEPSDSFFCIASGEAIIKVQQEGGAELIEIARVKPFDTIGELGLLLDSPRSATVEAGREGAVVLYFTKDSFVEMFAEIPKIGLVMSRVLARRFQQTSRSVLLPLAAPVDIEFDPAAFSLLPADFIQRHRVLPLRAEGNVLHVGFVEDPTPQIVNLARERLPGMQINPVLIDVDMFNQALQTTMAQGEWSGGEEAERAATQAARPAAPSTGSPKLDQMLRRMVAEGASDIHMSAGQKPRWRIDGVVHEMADVPALGPSEVLDLLAPLMPERNRTQFQKDNDTDFAYAIPDISRFRVNVFRDHKGVGAVFRQIPNTILTVEQLGMPPSILTVSDVPKGLVLVTGPTGSGKSTTLAAIIDHINRTRQAHIITLEDPIEFVHQSKGCIVNQREVGPHTTSFARALRAALREDPDIVLVGEMRDLETVALALETANTGHLVFGTLHTNTAVSTVSRVIDMFPAEQQNQIRTVLADTLKGVIAQTLCRRIGGGRIAALEIMVPNLGMASLIRDGKTQQLLSAMQTGLAQGNLILTNELVRLVREGLVAPEEAMQQAPDKTELARALGVR
ncbi:MAG: PilT/PilU family type 4a pilus ATPase [Kiritimatiellae bacterium]|nr:PilT/PilU family type 4a pilus ATPase [Kiritimatiellia bacterium]